MNIFQHINPLFRAGVAITRIIMMLALCAISISAAAQEVVEVEEITVTQPDRPMAEGNSLPLRATITPATATDQTLTWTWESTDGAEIKIEGTGKTVIVQALEVGNADIGHAVITVTASNGVAAQCTFTVKKFEV